MKTQKQIFEIEDIDWNKVNTFLDSLLKIESAADFCKAVVHSGFSGGYVQGCHLYRLGDDAHLSLAAGYGLSFDHLGDTFSIWDQNPVSTAVRERSFEFVSATSNSRPMIVVPLVRDSTPIGAATLILDAQVDSNPIDENLFPVLEKLSGYWLTSQTQMRTFSSGKASGSDGSNLTSRQLKILALMADGLVNAEIAVQLLVSESTVRQETVRIYRDLGVANRAEASRKGRLLGLIKSASQSI
jgi:DNA-binding CsgD family transcriptional regulator